MRTKREPKGEPKIRARRVLLTYESLDLAGQQPRRTLAELSLQLHDDAGDEVLDQVHTEVLKRLVEGINALRDELLEKLRRSHHAYRGMEDGSGR